MGQSYRTSTCHRVYKGGATRTSLSSPYAGNVASPFRMGHIGQLYSRVVRTATPERDPVSSRCVASGTWIGGRSSWLRWFPDRVQAGVAQERGQSPHVAGVRGQIARGEGVPQGVRAKVLDARAQRVLAQDAQTPCDMCCPSGAISERASHIFGICGTHVRNVASICSVQGEGYAHRLLGAHPIGEK